MQAVPEATSPAEAGTPTESETPEAAKVSTQVAPEPAHHIPLGSTVYIGEKEYELLAYGGENVTLYDPDCPLFNEVMSRSEFDAKLAENPLNSHLFTAHVDTPEVTEHTSAPEQAEAEATLEPEQVPTIQLAPPPAVRRHSKVSPTILHPEIPAEQRHNYRIHDDALGVGTPGEKFNRNVKAIRLLKRLEAEDRFAAPEEQEILAQYVGWGGLADCFDERHSKYGELKALLTEDEYAAARASTLNAHYTTPVVIRAIYDTGPCGGSGQDLRDGRRRHGEQAAGPVPEIPLCGAQPFNRTVGHGVPSALSRRQHPGGHKEGLRD